MILLQHRRADIHHRHHRSQRREQRPLPPATARQTQDPLPCQRLRQPPDAIQRQQRIAKILLRRHRSVPLLLPHPRIPCRAVMIINIHAVKVINWFSPELNQPRHRQMPASTLPITEWNTLEIAHGTAVNGSPGKCFLAKTTPSPEFCIPTSMETVRHTCLS